MGSCMIDHEKSKRLPLTSSQKELWLSQFASVSGFHEVSSRACFFVSCRVEPELLQKSIEIAIRHTPLLAASLVEEGGEPLFTNGTSRSFNLRFLDISDAKDPERALENFTDDFFELPVDECFVHFALVRLEHDKSVYVVKNSHLVLDGLGNFFHVSLVADIYRALKNGRDYPVEDGACHLEQYRQDRKYLESGRSASDIAFWEQHMARIPERRIFRALPGRVDVLGDTRVKKYYLSREVTEAIDRILECRSVGPAVYFAAVHALIVGFMCDERQITIQTPVAFGERKSFKKRQGAQLSLPPLFIDLDEHETFDSIAGGIAAQNSQFFRHIRTPYQLGMRRLEGRRFEYMSDLFMNFLPQLPQGNPDFPVVTVEQHHSPDEPALFGALVLREPETGVFSMNIRSSRNHLSRQDVERYVRRVELVSEQLARGVSLAQLDFLLDEEKVELARWQHGPEILYPHMSIPALFDEIAKSFPDAPAVCGESGASLTYAQLRENSVRCASWLAGRGVRPGEVVAVMAERTFNLPEVVLGIMRCGAVYLPVDPKSPPERLDHIVTDARAKLTIDPAGSGYLNAPPDGMFADVAPESGAYLIYTSGSTGRPKGVLAPHVGFVNMIRGQIDTFGVTANDHVLLFASPVFDASLSEMFMALFVGACLYPVGEPLRHDPWFLKRYMADNQVSVATLPPSYLRLFDGEPFSGLRVLITAGEPPVAADVVRYAEHLAYFNAYGPTETCVCASIKRVGPNEPLPVSVGKPIPNVTVRILNSRGSVLPAGMVGELWVGGASVSLGYHDRPELTEQKFRALPGVDEQVNYATGDLALWLGNGEIMLVGRVDDQVKIRGNRIELGEVAFLLEQCPGVRQAFVLAQQDVSGQPMLAAFLIPGNGFTVDDVVCWAQKNLPVYMIPSKWQILDSMPVTVTGKIDRKALSQLFEKTGESIDKPKEFNARLAALCEQALGRACDPERGFFEQGGNSLSGMSFLHAVRKEFSVDIPFRELMTCDSLFDLEFFLKQKTPVPTCSASLAAPLSRNQFRLWAYQQANEGTIDYNMPLLLEVTGERTEGFLEAFVHAVRSQELLSCTVSGEIDNPVFMKMGGKVSLRMTELADAVAASAFFDEQIHRPFDLRHEPPVRLEGVRLGDGVQLLVLMHHLVGDEETLRILLCNALKILDGQDVAQGLMATQAAYCDREQAYRSSNDYASDAAYWNQLLANPPTPLHSFSGRRGGMSRISLASEHVSALQELAAKSGVSILVVFATLVSHFLCERFKRREILIGTPVGMRETHDEFNCAGFYVNTVPLRLGKVGEADMASCMRETAGQVKAAVQHGRFSDFDVVPDVIATHGSLETIRGEGLCVRPLEPVLRASKQTASFVLETGDVNGIILEYDALSIPDGESLLQDFRDFVVDACSEVISWDKAQLLADAWEEILHTRPDENSDFLREGGDSIKAILMVGWLHRYRVSGLTAADFLRSPRFAELVELLCGQDDDAAECVVFPALEPGQHVPLLPLQRDLVRNHPEHWKTFFMLLPMEINTEVGAEIKEKDVRAWLQGLPERFEALCLAFNVDGARVLAEPQRFTLQKHVFDAKTSRKEVIRSVLRDIAVTLDPEIGNTFGTALAEHGDVRLVILVGHHLVLDAVSFDVLRQDLTSFCRTGRGAGEQHGVATRAVEIARLSESGDFPCPAERDFWEDVCRTPTGQLLAEKSGQADIVAERELVWEHLDGFRLEHTNTVTADLLSALSAALHAAGQRETVFVALESHGRDSLPDGIRVEQAVGWFTSVCHMPLKPFPDSSSARGEVLPWLSEHFHARNGNAYGILKGQESDRFSCSPRIGFNYFGKVGDAVGELFGPCMAEVQPGDIPELLHPDFSPEIPLELTVYFDGLGVLHLGAYFSPQVLPVEWVDSLLHNWAASLRDFPAYLEPLSESLAARIQDLCRCTKGDIEAVHPPEKTHTVMLEQQQSAEPGVFTQQIEFLFRGELDELLLTRAWSEVVARHEMLRSLFPSPSPGTWFRVVLKRPRMNVEFHDLSWLPEQMASERMKELLEAGRKGAFDFNAGPLLRSQFFRMSDDRFVVSWCSHHLLMDGWCIGIILEQLFAAYSALESGVGVSLPEPMPLTEYAAWRSCFDEDFARNYWNSLLDGFVAMTPVSASSNSPGVGDPESVVMTLDKEISEKLQAIASAKSITLFIMFQSLWALLLSTRNKDCRDVVFRHCHLGQAAGTCRDRSGCGAVHPDRSRARSLVPGPSSFDDLLHDVREQSLNQMQHGYLPLSEVRQDVTDHTLVYQNYPVDGIFSGTERELLDVNGYEKTIDPLSVAIVPGDCIYFDFLYDPDRMSRAEVQGLFDDLHALTQALPAEGTVGCAELEKVIRAGMLKF